MAIERWKDYAELVGIASIVASLIFVGIEVRQSSSAGQVDQTASYGEMMLSVRALLTEHADVWQRACSGAQLTQAEATTAAQLYRAYAEFMWVQGVSSGVGTINFRNSLAERFAANVHRYPGFAALFKANGDWGQFGEPSVLDNAAILEFTELVLNRIEELSTIDPNPNYDVSWCGF